MIVQILIYAFATLFIFMAVVMMLAYQKTPLPSLLLVGIIYGASAVLALMLMLAWPLFVGLLLVIGLRLLGYDPTPQLRAPPKSDADDQPSGKRDQS